jgi:hypothetical protein
VPGSSAPAAAIRPARAAGNAARPPVRGSEAPWCHASRTVVTAVCRARADFASVRRDARTGAGSRPRGRGVSRRTSAASHHPSAGPGTRARHPAARAPGPATRARRPGTRARRPTTRGAGSRLPSARPTTRARVPGTRARPAQSAAPRPHRRSVPHPSATLAHPSAPQRGPMGAEAVRAPSAVAPVSSGPRT